MAAVGPIIPESILTDQQKINPDQQQRSPSIPSWVTSAAKLLNGGSEGQDWLALAKRLGYKKSRILHFEEDVNPGLAVIVDWIISSGNTPLSVDLMVSCLDHIDRHDIVEIIEKEREQLFSEAQVFISYQWDIQDDVKLLRDWLEQHGYTCWMDLGQMGGGDQLHAKIDDGIRHCKVVIACVTPKFVVSHLCNRELSLADVLRKPIIPVMYEQVPWPPPGGMALMFSQLVYVDMKGVGGHGGSGVHADTEARHHEILQVIRQHAEPFQPAQSSNTNLPAKPDKLTSSARTDSSSSASSLNITPPAPPSYLLSVSSDRSMNSRRVSQVHVSKCGVCTIL